MSSKDHISDEDKALFRDMVGEVKPVEQQQANIAHPKPKARPLQREADDRQVLKDLLSDHHEHIETGEELSYHQPGLQKTVLRKLRRGQYAIEAEIDLHGYRSDDARRELVQFLAECKANGARCVRVIHGKALHRSEGPVLKPLVNSWLRQRGDVLAFCSASPRDGGTGAVYVLLKGK